MDTNSPADGIYDFLFELYDGSNTIDSNQIGDTIDINDLDVIDGYFTVELDFGQYAFNADARWLEVAVRPGDSDDVHTILSPRQQVTPAPYSIRAHIADSSADGVTGSGTTNRLAKFTATKVVSDSAICESGGNVGIGTTSPESRLQIEQNAGAWDEGIRLSYGDHAWDFVTDCGGERLTIAPDQNSTRGLVMRNGNAGIGTSSPEARSHVNQSVGAWGEGIRLSYGDHEWDIVTDSGGERLFIAQDQTGEKGLIIIDGRVGIGTTNPGAKLEVKQNAWQDIVKVGTPDTSNRLILSSGPDYASVSGGQTNQNSIVISHSTGNVGIGPSGTLPEAKLQVNGDLKAKGDVTVDGAYVGSFPRLAYDSGWVPLLQNQELTCIHNLGGNVDNYVVDLQMKDTDYYGINNMYIGGDSLKFDVGD